MGACVFDGYIDVPMSKVPFNVSATDGAGHPYRFSLNSNIPMIAQAQYAVSGDIDGMQLYICNPLGLTTMLKAGTLAVPNNIEVNWFNGSVATANPFNNTFTTISLPRVIGAFPYTLKSIVPFSFQVGGGAVGPYEVPGPEGPFPGYRHGMICLGNVFVSIGQTNCYMQSNFLGGQTALQWEGTSGVLGYVGWFAGVGGIGTQFFNTQYFVNGDPPIGRAYLVKNPSRPRVLMKAVAKNLAPDPPSIYGTWDNPVFDNALLETATDTGADSEFSTYQNGWTAVLRVPNLSRAGAAWTFVVMNHDQTLYKIVRFNNADAGTVTILNNAGAIPSFKVDVDGVLWLIGGVGNGLLYSSYDYASPQPPFYPMPLSTFALPCYDPCDGDIWT